MNRNAALEAAILAEPDAAGPYAVYADWLLLRDDPRGELITVQLQREHAPDDPVLAARERSLLADHGNVWLDGLDTASWIAGPITVTWRRGFVDTAVIPTSYESNEATHLYTSLAALPVAIALRHLEIGVAITYHGRGPADTSVLEALRDLPPRVLRSLVFSPHEHSISWTSLGDIAIANAALQSLEELEIAAGRLSLGAVDLPRLRTLRLVTGGLPSAVVAEIVAARWPRLTELVLYFGSEIYGGSCELADLRPILDGIVDVRALGLCNAPFADALVPELVRSNILRRLRTLDLSKGTLGEVGAAALLAHADAFAHLEVLDLRENYLSPADCAQLATVCARVLVSEQKAGDGDRYVSLAE